MSIKKCRSLLTQQTYSYIIWQQKIDRHICIFGSPSTTAGRDKLILLGGYI